MHCLDGVRSAIHNLAGIYVYDYCPSESLRCRIRQRFRDAEARFTLLLDGHACLDLDRSRELVTMVILLSMFDVSLAQFASTGWTALPMWLHACVI